MWNLRFLAIFLCNSNFKKLMKGLAQKIEFVNNKIEVRSKKTFVTRNPYFVQFFSGNANHNPLH